jgi:pimeloyl-ACP methyl ester carboxylesterase
MANIVLCYGGWGGQWSWDLVAPELRRLGHEVRTPDLPLETLAGDTAAVQAAVDELGGPVLVAGWSYGGMVITGLELPVGSHLVYIAAFMPDEGESLDAIVSGSPPSPFLQVLQFNEDGTVTVPADKATEPLWPDAPADVAARAATAVASRAQAVGTMSELPERIAWKSTPSTYLLCTKDQAILPEDQRRMATHATEIVEWDCSHSPSLARPAELVALLDALAP